MFLNAVTILSWKTRKYSGTECTRDKEMTWLILLQEEGVQGDFYRQKEYICGYQTRKEFNSSEYS